VHHPLSQFISEDFSTSWHVNACTTATPFRCSYLPIWNKFIRIWDAKYFWSKYGQHWCVSSSLAGGGNAFCWIATERPFTFVQHTLIVKQIWAALVCVVIASAGGNAFATERPFTFVQHTPEFGLASDCPYAEINATMIPNSTTHQSFPTSTG